MRRPIQFQLLRMQAAADPYGREAQLLRVAASEGITEIDPAEWRQLSEKYPIQQPLARSLSQRRGPCRFKGEQFGTVKCKTCCGNVQLKVFACSKHDKCVVGESADGLQSCATCKEHEPMTYE